MSFPDWIQNFSIIERILLTALFFVGTGIGFLGKNLLAFRRQAQKIQKQNNDLQKNQLREIINLQTTNQSLEKEKEYYFYRLEEEQEKKRKSDLQEDRKQISLKIQQQEDLARWKQAKLFSQNMAHRIGNCTYFLNGTLKNLQVKGVSSFDQEKYQSLKNGVRNIQSILREMKELQKPISNYRRSLDILEELNLLIQAIRSSSVLIEIQSQEIPPLIPLHPEHFQQSIGELLQNTVKVNDGKVQIQIQLFPNQSPPEVESLENRRSRSFLKIKILDNGIGVPLEKKEEIFHPFVSQTHGTGLGLAIVKRIVEIEHQGYILETGTEKQGACFEVYFPQEES